ncbi:MAG: DNA topoisomerase I [Thermoplasmata archaeon HGW-Thermoplasmata-1]|nr:MAG: DNA topoisomerase I [Thermoplasmata archaeon HGW-Thermoplasmata-1]
MSILVICEKNIAARRIAQILSDGRSKQSRIGRVPVYEFEADGKHWDVIGLRGHIMNLDFPKEYNQWTRIDPAKLVRVEPYKKVEAEDILDALGRLAKESDEVVIATDFDREGELIGVEGLEAVKHFKSEFSSVKRARFSALTPYEVKTAFDNLAEVDYNLVKAAESRQIIDLVWGASLTRFISLASGQLGKEFLSAGRVQSPALALVVDREKEINAFVSTPYWEIDATLQAASEFKASHAEDRFTDEGRAHEAYERARKAKAAKITAVEKKENRELPPTPFNTTSFIQAVSYLNIGAAEAMSIAETLYTNGFISYPRTDNTVYPPSLNLRAIVEKLAADSDFASEARDVLDNGRYAPTKGKLSTTDHPPIHPADVPAKGHLKGKDAKIYELVVRRFLATLAKDAVSETVKVELEISGEPFCSRGYRLLESNWRAIYPYMKVVENELPELFAGQEADVTEVGKKKKMTRPPARYSQGSLITEMEKLGLGTKSTRHEIVNKLYQRKYIDGTSPQPTKTGFAVTEALENYAPKITRPEMTATLEADMDEIANGKKELGEVVEESRQMLEVTFGELKKNRDGIGSALKDALSEQNVVGTCPVCGSTMQIMRSRKGKRFVGCTGYPKCSRAYPLPQNGGVVSEGRACDACGAPIVKIISKGRSPWEICINMDCPKRKEEKKEEGKQNPESE